MPRRGRPALPFTQRCLAAPAQTFIQVGNGKALRIDAGPYLDAVKASSTTLQTNCCDTGYARARGTEHCAPARYLIEARLARWLLMCHDRVEGDEIHLDHDFIGMMIAAERSGGTVSLHIPEGAGMIQSKRGRTTILDGDKLEELAGDSYGVPEAEYRHLVGPLGRNANLRH